MSAPIVAILHSTCCYFDIVGLHHTLSLELVKRGATCIHILTDAEACTYFSQLPISQERHCHRLHTLSEHFLDSASYFLQPEKIVYLRLEDYSKQVEDRAACEWARLLQREANPMNFSIWGLPLWDLVKSSLSRYCFLQQIPQDASELSNRDAGMLSRFMKSAIRYYLAFSRLYREHSVSQLLVFNGLYYQERIAMEVAWQTRIDVIATEGSCFEDRKYYYKVPQSSDLRPPLRETAKVALASRTPMGPDRYSRLQRFLNQSYNGCNNWVKQPPECTGLEKKIGIDPGRRGKIALFFGQVPYDSAITSCRPYISAYEAMRRTADYFISKQDWHLIIRFHPGDSLADEEENVVGKFLQLRSMPPNVSLVKGFDINTYQLMRIADIGITISSQAGLEMLGMHKPVAVIGNAIYGGLGITIDANSGLDYEELFDRALRFTPSDDWRRRTDLLLEYFIFDYLVRIDRYTGQFVEGGSDRVVQLFLDGNFS